jgi:hypothetical protein
MKNLALSVIFLAGVAAALPSGGGARTKNQLKNLGEWFLIGGIN